MYVFHLITIAQIFIYRALQSWQVIRFPRNGNEEIMIAKIPNRSFRSHDFAGYVINNVGLEDIDCL